MKLRIDLFTSGLIVFLLLIFNVTTTKSQPPEGHRNMFTTAIDKAKPTIVNISVYNVDGKSSGGGSGVIINLPDTNSNLFKNEEYILTNYHVVKDAHHIVVYPLINLHLEVPIPKQYEADLVGYDSINDLAVLKIDTGLGRNFEGIEWGNSDEVQVGEWAIALGHPYSPQTQTHPTVTVGIVSATNRIYPFEEDNILLDPFRKQKPSFYGEVIQTDAAINKGNSGGALVNIDGQLIGINTFIKTRGGGSEGVGFAVPANTAKNVAEQIKMYGSVVPPNLGMETKTVSKKLGDFDVYAHHVLVSAVKENSPAALAGFKPNSRIFFMYWGTNAKLIKNENHFKAIARLFPIDEKITFMLVGDEGEELCTLIPRQWKKYVAPMWGITVKQPTFAETIGKYERRGVIVIHAEPWTVKKNVVKLGALIYQINNRKINSLEDFRISYEIALEQYRHFNLKSKLYSEQGGEDISHSILPKEE